MNVISNNYPELAWLPSDLNERLLAHPIPPLQGLFTFALTTVTLIVMIALVETDNLLINEYFVR
jgi:hypothetical protein